LQYDEAWWSDKRLEWAKKRIEKCICGATMDWVGIGSDGRAVYHCPVCGNCKFIWRLKNV